MDAWLLYKDNRSSRLTMTPNEFYSALAEQLIDNKYGVTNMRSLNVEYDVTDVTASGVGPHLTPSRRKRKRHDGSLTNSIYQGRCRVCKDGHKSKFVCSECSRDMAKDVWICHSDTGRDCFSKHLRTSHLQE